MIVVADAGPIIHLSLINLLRLLPALYQRVLIPDLVYKEVVVDGDVLAGSAELREARWIEVISHDPGAPLFQLLRAQLDPGEAAAISLAVARKPAMVLSDDRPARLMAEQLGLAEGPASEGKRRAPLRSRRAPESREASLRGATLEPARFAACDHSSFFQFVGQPGNAADEVAMVAGVPRTGSDQVGHGAAVRE